MDPNNEAKKGGRPRIADESLRRNQILRASATKAERLFINHAARTMGVSTSMLLLDGALLLVVLQEGPGAVALLEGISDQEAGVQRLLGRLNHLCRKHGQVGGDER